MVFPGWFTIETPGLSKSRAYPNQSESTLAVSPLKISAGMSAENLRSIGQYPDRKDGAWRTFGEETSAGVSTVVAPRLSSDGTAYAYIYVRVLSEAYVVTGLR
jgi:hypothetical protein